MQPSSDRVTTLPGRDGSLPGNITRRGDPEALKQNIRQCINVGRIMDGYKE